LIGSAVFAGLSSVTDRQTDRPTDHAPRSVTIGRICVRSTAMQPDNNNKPRVDCVPKTREIHSVVLPARR